MSAKLFLYNAVKTKLLAIKNDSDVAIVKTSGHWNNQFDLIEEEIQINFPAAFISFTNMDWSTDVGVANKNSTQQQRSKCNIEIHVGITNLKDEYDSFPEDIAIIDSIHDQLNGLQGTQFTPLKRIAEVDDTNKGNIRHWVITYETELHEKGYSGTMTDATEGGTVEIKFEQTNNYA